MLRRQHRALSSFGLVTTIAATSAFVACGNGSPTQNLNAGATSSSSASSGEPVTVDDIMDSLPKSCAFQCTDCEEPDKPYDCPTSKGWSTLPHDDACPD